MLKVTKNINFKAALAGAAILTTLSTLVPDQAQAFPFGGNKRPNQYGINFNIDNSKDNIGPIFKEAIQGFEVFDGDFLSSPKPIVGTANKSFDLQVKLFSDTSSITQSNNNFSFGDDSVSDIDECLSGDFISVVNSIEFTSCFSNISGSLYEFSFTVTNSDVTVDPSVFDLNNNGRADYDDFELEKTIAWYIPSIFTYTTAAGKTFNIDFGDGGSFLTSLDSLGAIFNEAASNNIEKVYFPTGEGSGVSYIGFATNSTSVPEPGATTSLLALGLLGGLTYYKRKIS